MFFCESFNDLPSTLFSKAALISFVTSTSVFLCTVTPVNLTATSTSFDCL
ncbi:hypothetical protein [Spiroplasma endosymbiont of Lariophagus distinguendus]|nr:hypothetical protein [Spiroplasma endosymbiont of Lariophagus distinguendus]